MPKLKSHSSAVKRIARSGSGKIIARHMSITHRARFKSKRTKLQAAKKQVLNKTLAKKIAQITGN